MNSDPNNQDFSNNQKALEVCNKIGAVLSLSLLLAGFVPFYPGCAMILIAALSGALTAFSKPEFPIEKHFLSFGTAMSPIWILFLDPCALSLAQTMGAVNFQIITSEHKRTAVKAFYMVLSVIPWLIIWFARGSSLDECSETISSHLSKSIIVFVAMGSFSTASASILVDSHLKATKHALAQIKQLNAKFDTLNTELKELIDDKDNFILLFSHETRNPLNILVGNLAMLMDEVENPSTKSRVARCQFCTDLLLHYLNNILDSGKLANKGALEITPTTLRPQEYFLSITSFMEMLVKKKKALTPVFYIPENLPKVLKFDTQRLTQIVLNLLTNAVKFTEKGEISMVVRYLKKETLHESDYYPTTALGYNLLSGDNEGQRSSLTEFPENPLGSDIQLCERFKREIHPCEERKDELAVTSNSPKGFFKLEITDTGCGMKEEELVKLFKKFSQTHAEGYQRQIGTGLGLWITKNLCELMNGGVKVFSKPNVGTCFTAIVQADTVLTPHSREVRKMIPNNLNSTVRRILIADDDPFNLEFHVKIFKEFGYSVIETAFDGQNLVDIFMKRPERYYEAIVTDISMPRVDGIQAASMIREYEKKQTRSNHVKIGFITGHSNFKDQHQCDAGPINALFYLAKPIKPAMLKSFLQHEADTSDIQDSRFTASLALKTWKSKPLVLCIDDDIFNLECLTDMLQSLEAKSLKAQSGEEGLKLLTSLVVEGEKAVSFVFLDCRMGGMDGWEASRQMKNLLRTHNKQQIPIIGLTGEDKNKNIENFKLSEMDDLIQKPISRATLQGLLEKYAL